MYAVKKLKEKTMKKIAIILLVLFLPSLDLAESLSDSIQQFAKENMLQVEVSKESVSGKDVTRYKFRGIPQASYFQIVKKLIELPNCFAITAGTQWQDPSLYYVYVSVVENVSCPNFIGFLQAQEKLFSQKAKIESIAIGTGLVIGGSAESYSDVNALLATVRKIPLFEKAELRHVEYDKVLGHITFNVVASPGK